MVSKKQPVKRRKEARPGEIIRAGMHEFAKNGFADTRLEDVAKRAGIAKGTIYRYFDNKEALFLAAVLSYATPIFEQIDGVIDGYQGTTRELLTHLFKVIHANLVHGELHILLRIIITEGRKFPELPKLYHRVGVRNGQKMLKRIIDRGIAAGEIRPGAATNLPIVIMAPALMAAVWKMTFEDQQPIAPEKFLDAHLDLVLNGIMK